MIWINEKISMDDSEVTFEFIRSSGPGGQNVNKVATAVRLYFDIKRSPSLPEEVKERLLLLAGKKAGEDGVLVILSRRHRTQQANRREAVERLADLILRACVKPKKRKKTNPSRASRERRLLEKRQRSEKKSLRRSVGRPGPE